MVRSFFPRLLTVLASAAIVCAQTKVDLQHQAKGIDFTGATYTKPSLMGTALPGSCAAGQTYILSSAAAGSNFYICLAPNTWALQGGGTSGSGSTGTPGILSSSVSGPNLTVGSNCSATAPCNVRVGETVYAFVAAATANLTGGTGTAYVYVSPSGTLTVGHNLTLTCTSGCTAVSGITAFPAGSVPLAAWPASGGTWGVGTDARAILSIDNYLAGAGLLAATNANSTQFSVDPTVFLERGAISNTVGQTLCTDSSGNATTSGCPSGGGGSGALTLTTTGSGASTLSSGTLNIPMYTKASGTAALTTSPVAANGGCNFTSVAASGVASTDVIQATPNVDPTGVAGYAPSGTGSLTIYAYPTAGNVNFKVCNPTGSSITPAAMTMNWKVSN